MDVTYSLVRKNNVKLVIEISRALLPFNKFAVIILFQRIKTAKFFPFFVLLGASQLPTLNMIFE
jgi:hypothetical protein